MKRFYLYIICVLPVVLASCSSTKNEAALDSTWMQIQPGMTKEKVYTDLGQPIRETNRESEWRRPEGRGWRVVVISFDENSRVTVVRGHQEQK